MPKYLFKLVYDPTTGKVWAHRIENRDDAVITLPISYEELTARTGVERLGKTVGSGQR